MQRLRLLATSLLTSACVLPAAAQSPAAPPPHAWYSSTITTFDTQPLSTPPTFSAPLPQSDPLAAKPYSFHFDIAKSNDSIPLALHADTQPFGVQVSDDTLKDLKTAHIQKINPLLAQIHPPCYTLRVYGFTPQDLKSPHPHSSSETDCTPASSAHLKALQLPGTVNAK
jgi:hypothetical protein